MKEVWEEVFAGKTYTTHTLAISGGSVLLHPLWEWSLLPAFFLQAEELSGNRNDVCAALVWMQVTQ